jgi:hypothetical protein
MLLEKWHEPELLVDLAAPEIVDWQSWVVPRPGMSERTRSFVRYVFHQASRNTRLHRCFFQEFIVQARYNSPPSWRKAALQTAGVAMQVEKILIRSNDWLQE